MEKLEQLKAESLMRMQKIVDELKHEPQFKQYIQQRKLSLLDSKFALIDRLLTEGKLI